MFTRGAPQLPARALKTFARPQTNSGICCVTRRCPTLNASEGPALWSGSKSTTVQHRYGLFHNRKDARHFSTSHCLLKKGGKAAREEKQASPKSEAADDPFDFSTLEEDIATSIERLKSDLSQLKAGGRFNPQLLENLRVQPDKNNKQTVKLNDLAQVIPKGRTVQLLVGEKEYIKPISSAIQSSNLSLTPQPDPTGVNPLLLIINIPPPTTESRRWTVEEATKAGQKAVTAVRDARAKQQKKQRKMEGNKAVRPDDLRKSQTMMEKLVEKGQDEAKRIVDNAKKALESG